MDADELTGVFVWCKSERCAKAVLVCDVVDRLACVHQCVRGIQGRY